MRKSRFTYSQVAKAFNGVEHDLAVLELFQEIGIKSAKIYDRRAKCGGIDASMMARRRELGVKNPGSISN